jgi:hypothetical protein
MNQAKTPVSTVLSSLLSLALVIALGIVSHSFWVGLLCLVGLSMVVKTGIDAVGRKPGAFSFSIILGASAMIVAYSLSHGSEHWLWKAAWALVALRVAISGAIMTRAHKTLGAFGIIIGLTCALFALLGPQIVASGGALSAATAVPAGHYENMQRFAQFLMIRTGWITIYLLLIICLGLIIHWSCGVLAFIAALAVVWFVGGPSQPAMDTLIRIFSSGPAVLMKEILTASATGLGSPAWGILLSGAGLTLLTLPASIVIARGNSLGGGTAARQGLGSTVGRIFQRQQQEAAPKYALSLLLSTIMSIAVPIALWVALRRISGTAAGTGFLSIPDITVPNGTPLLKLAYFIAPLAICLAGFLFRPRLPNGSLLPFLPTLAVFLIVPVVAALFVPAGVMIFLFSQVLLSGIVRLFAPAPKRSAPPVPEALQEQGAMDEELQRQAIREVLRRHEEQAEAKQQMPPVAPPAPPDQQVRQPPLQSPDALRTILEGTPQPAPRPAPAAPAPGSLPYRHREPIVDLAVTETGTCFFLDAAGRCIGLASTADSVLRLEMKEPLGLASLGRGRLAAIDAAGRITIVDSGQGVGAPVDSIPTSSPLRCFSVNAFGTSVAFAGAGRQVAALFLASKKEQALVEDAGTITALAYSADARHLAIGSATGEVRILDMASRQIVATLQPSPFAPGQVRAISIGPEGRWWVSYESQHIACWSKAGALERSRKLPHSVSAFTADPVSGRVAVGSDRGDLRVLPADLEDVLFASPAPMHAGRVARVVFVENGAALISAGSDGAVHRIAL